MRCFPAGAPVLLADGATAPIETIRPGDLLAAFAGFGALVARLANEHGRFELVEAIVARGGRLVDADGALVRATATRIAYSAETAHLFPETEAPPTPESAGATALATARAPQRG